MGRQVVALTGGLVESLPEPCRTCLFWELGGPCPDRRSLPAAPPRHPVAAPSRPLVRKQAWVSAVVQDSRPAGRVVLVDDELVAHALAAPPQRFAPRSAGLPAASPDALLLASVWVQPHWRGRGLGGLLVRAVLKDALRDGRRRVEAYGDRRWRERACTLPAGWLLGEGFDVEVEHPRSPLLAIDLGRTARWTEGLEHALGGLLAPRPAGARVTDAAR